jgi:hypothetical protein
MLIDYIIENIEIWDVSAHFSFAKSLNKSIDAIIKKIESHNSNSNNNNSKNYNHFEYIINTIIKFCIRSISNEEKEIGDEYIKNFNEIVENLSEKYRIHIEEEIVNYASLMGSFGKPTTFRRYSAYFCASLIRVGTGSYPNEELLKRFLILTSDSDVCVRMEISYHIRFVFKELDEISIKKNFYKIVRIF